MKAEEDHAGNLWAEQTAVLTKTQKMTLDDFYDGASVSLDAETAASIVSKRQLLQNREAEIAAHNTSLEEAARANQKREVEIRLWIEVLDRATTVMADKARQRKLIAKEEENRRKEPHSSSTIAIVK